MRIKKAGAIAALLLAPLGAQAFQIVSLSPQGEVARVRQLVAKFDESAVNFGDPKAEAPLTLSCSDAQVTKGSGRWVTDRSWTYQFEDDLPPGVRCSAQVRAGFKSPKGVDISGTTRFSFNTGGPFVKSISPNTYQRIGEDQYFALLLSGEAAPASVQANVWCAVEGLGERVAVRAISGPERDAIIKASGWKEFAAASPLSVLTLACNRKLTSDAKVQLVFGKGVSTPAKAGAPGVENTVEKRFGFQVRQAFEAAFNCERENAQSACLPIRPMQLSFNAPVQRKLLEGIRLKSDKETFKPVFANAQADDSAGEDVVTGISFGPVLPERTQFTLELPKDFKDDSARLLRNAENFPLKVATGGMPPLAKFAASPFGVVERLA